MKELKPSDKKRKVDKSRLKKPKPAKVEEEYEEDDRPIYRSPTEDDDAPVGNRKIEVKQTPLVREVVPGHVFRQSAFKFQPSAFGLESQRLNERIIEASVQTNSLSLFLKDPTRALVYSVSGNPDESKARYFAAYLVQEHIKAMGEYANVIWYPMYGGYSNPLMDRSDDLGMPSMIVLTNLTPVSTQIKLEKARDILARYQDIPRIVVSAGMDPLSFMTTRLHSAVNALAYFSESLVKMKVQII
jgi:hypothetical protein